MWVQVPGWCERRRKLIQAEAEALARVVSFRDFDARAIIDVPSVHDDVLANCARDSTLVLSRTKTGLRENSCSGARLVVTGRV